MIKRYHFQIVVYLTVVIVLGGCQTMFVYSEHDNTLPFNKKQLKIGIYVDSAASLSDRNIATYISNEMKAMHFNIVSLQNANYILTFSTVENTTKINTALFLPMTTTSSGNIGGVSYSGSSTSIQSIPYSYDYTVRRIWFYLFTRESLQENKPKTVWEGYFGVDSRKFQNNPTAIIQTFLKYFEQNFKDNVEF